MIRCAMIGYGKIGKLRHRLLSENKEIDVVALCDVMPIETEHSAAVYSDWKEVLNLKPDAVFVCTPNRFIPEITINAINKGINVFAEKPPGCTVEDVLAMQEAEKKNKSVKLKFGFNHRYHDSVMDAKHLIESQKLGSVIWMRGVYGKAGGSNYDQNWRNNRAVSGGGILIDQGIHMLDLFHYLSNDHFSEFKSFVEKKYWKQTDVEDNVFAMMRNGDGVVATLHSSATQWRHMFRLEIGLEKGLVELSGILSSTMTYGKEMLKIARCVYDENNYPLPNPNETVRYYSDDHSWKKEIEEFIDCVKFNKPIQHGTIEEALAVMTCVHAIYDNDGEG